MPPPPPRLKHPPAVVVVFGCSKNHSVNSDRLETRPQIGLTPLPSGYNKVNLHGPKVVWIDTAAPAFGYDRRARGGSIPPRKGEVDNLNWPA